MKIIDSTSYLPRILGTPAHTTLSSSLHAPASFSPPAARLRFPIFVIGAPISQQQMMIKIFLLLQAIANGLEHSSSIKWLQIGRRIGGAALAALQIASNNPVLRQDVAWSYSAQEEKEKARESVYEVWDLLNKYYYDTSALRNENFQESRTKYGQGAFNEPEAAGQARAQVVKSLKADKYTRLIDAAQYEAISKYDILGIGLILQPGDDGICRITSPPLPGSSAAKAGLSVDDTIISIDGVDVKGLSSFDYLDIVSKVGGNSINLKLGSGRELTLARKLDAVADPVPTVKISQDGTGYLRLTEFNTRTDRRLGTILSDLIDDKKAKAIVIDLRGNGGGAFQSAIDAASYFLPTGTPVVDIVEQEKDPGSPLRSTFRAKDKQPPNHKIYNFPLELWIDRGSASSSEVFAGALRDNCAAVVAGKQTSFGKGLIQAVLGLIQAEGGLIVTVAQYYTPANKPVQGIGISPDIPLPTTSFFAPISLPESTKVQADFAALSQSCSSPFPMSRTTK
uniref:PDZ domain-containing protein n=1 Tax=Aureoumbra lagunensis TaxID=44058 RepID=A0A7S3K1L2_9STRA